MRTRAAACCACLALLGACTADSGSDPQPSPSASGEGSVVPSVSPSLGGFAEGDEVLDVAITEPSTLDPMRIQDPGSVLVARQLFESLTAWDQATEEVVPAAAESWDISDGGRRFTFTLRQGMTFHDGTPVTSRDFAFAFDRIAARRNASQLAYTLDRVDGFTEVNQTGDSRSLRGIRTPDDLTLVIQLSEPFMEFPALLTHPGLVPLPEAAVEDEEEFLATPIGNGPFQMAEPWAP
jgi:oligopeptide transport system substrate-binding protein